MSDKPIVRDYDHQVAPGVDAHTHEETKTGKNTYEHKAETGFEGPNVTGSAYEKTKVTLAEDKSKHASTHGTSATSGSHTSQHSSSQHAASHTTSSSQHSQSSALDSRHQQHHDSSVTGADGKPIVRDYDYQVAPGVAAHTHEELKTGKNTYEHKAETGFEGPNVVGSAYEKTTVKMSGGDKSAAGSHHHSEHGHHAEHQQQHATSGSSYATSGTSASSTHTELDSRHHASGTTASSAGTVSTKPIERDYDYQPAPGVQAHTHEVIKQGTNTYEHKAETTFEGPNTTGSAYEKTTVKMSGPKHT